MTKHATGRGVSRATTRLFVSFLGILGFGLNPAAAAAQDRDEVLDGIKVNFLRNFTFPEYVGWPGDAFAREDSPIVIGILGADPFGERLDAMVKKFNETLPQRQKVRALEKKKPARLIELRRAAAPAALAGCHVVYISPPEEGALPAILAAFKGTATVTVGDTKGFAEKGVVLNMTVEVVKAANGQAEKSVGLEMNPDAAGRARGVRFGAVILAARKVGDKKP